MQHIRAIFSKNQQTDSVPANRVTIIIIIQGNNTIFVKCISLTTPPYY